MSYTSKIMSKLDGAIQLKALFPTIGLMTLPKDNGGNYISFRKSGSDISGCLDNTVRDNCSYVITLYAKEFKDLEDSEILMFNLFHGIYLKNEALDVSGLVSITSIIEEEDTVLNMYKKIYTLTIK